MGLIVSALYLLLTIVIIFGVAWMICWLLKTFIPQVPGQVQNFIYIIAAILAIIYVVVWLGSLSGGIGSVFPRAHAAEIRHDVGRSAVVHERVVPRLDVHRREPAFVAPRRLRGCDRVLKWRCW
jgi:heme A synthase